MGNNKNKWDLEKMQVYCDNLNIGYKILDMKWIQKPYQKQQWAIVKCNNSQHEPYLVWWNQFIRGSRCKKCDYESKGKQIWTKEKAYKFFKSYGYEMSNINNWKNVDQTVWCFDKNMFNVRPSITNLRSNIHPSRFQYNKYALENIRLYCKLYRPDYDIVSNKYIKIKSQYSWIYQGVNLPINIDPVFQQTADNFINGGFGHPYFFKSNGNEIFENELVKNYITYEREKTFKGCKDKKMLRFDFYLPELNEVIEIDGEQHHVEIEYFGGKKGYEDRVKKDSIKNEYCENNGIKLTRIRYKTNQIEIFKNEIVNKMEKILEETINYSNIPSNLRMPECQNARVIE